MSLVLRIANMYAKVWIFNIEFCVSFSPEKRKVLLVKVVVFDQQEICFHSFEQLKRIIKTNITSYSIFNFQNLDIHMRYILRTSLESKIWPNECVCLTVYLFTSSLNFNKAEFAEEGTFFANRFPSMRTFVNKKVGIRKTQNHT